MTAGDTGSFDGVDTWGTNGLELKDKRNGYPKTYLKVQAEDFPNVFMIMAPHTALSNIPALDRIQCRIGG